MSVRDAVDVQQHRSLLARRGSAGIRSAVPARRNRGRSMSLASAITRHSRGSPYASAAIWASVSPSRTTRTPGAVGALALQLPQLRPRPAGTTSAMSVTRARRIRPVSSNRVYFSLSEVTTPSKRRRRFHWNRHTGGACSSSSMCTNSRSCSAAPRPVLVQGALPLVGAVEEQLERQRLAPRRGRTGAAACAGPAPAARRRSPRGRRRTRWG